MGAVANDIILCRAATKPCYRVLLTSMSIYMHSQRLTHKMPTELVQGSYPFEEIRTKFMPHWMCEIVVIMQLHENLMCK